MPQLDQLREEFMLLKKEGHVDEKKKKRIKKYANNMADDEAAEQAVMKEFGERSARTALNATNATNVTSKKKAEGRARHDEKSR